MSITADYIVAQLKVRVTLPASQVLLEDEDFLTLADAVVQSGLIPLLESTNGDFFVTSSDVSLVASQSEYDIPYRAIGRAMREIKLKETATPTNIRNLIKVEIEDKDYYGVGDSSICGFYFKGDRLRLVPDVPSTLTVAQQLEIWHRLAPNKLTLLENVCTVVSATSTIVTVDAVPSTITASTPIDFIQGRAGCRIYSIDKTPTAAGATTLTFATGVIPSDLTAGDYIALAGYSPVLNMIPNECYPYFESLLAKRVLKAIGDYEGSKELNEDIKDEKAGLLLILEPRIDGEPTVINNRTGLVRGNKGSQRRWFRGT